MRFEQSLVQKQIQTLRQIMSPRMIQRLGRFNQSYDTLLDTVKTETQDNMFLKVIKQDKLSSYGGHRKLSARQDYAGEDDMFDPLSQHIVEESLTEHLNKQLDLESLGEKESAIIGALIEGLDSRGYVSDYAVVRDQIVKDFGVAERKVGELLKVLQTFEPEGVGARTLKECLLIQVKEHNFESEELRSALKVLVRDHLEDLANENYGKITKATGFEEEGILQLSTFIRDNLNPNPASEFSQDNFTRHVVPSFKCEIVEGELKISNLEAEKGVQLSISEEYLEKLSDPNLDKESKTFLELQLQKAKQLIEDIEQRRENLTKLMEIIAKRQADFFKKGEAYLEPLMQKEISEKLKMSPSTVSRIISSKYVQTDNGILSLRSLCPRDHFGKTAVKLEKLICDFCKRYPHFSDRKIAGMLKMEFGMAIARRTVTKYRLQAGEPSSFDRRSDTSVD